MSGFAGRVEKLSARRRDLLELLLMEKSRKAAREQEIPRRKPADHAPLSFAQHRLWFLHRLTPRSPYYNMSRAIRFSGVLSLDALRRTFDEIAVRHESLRTSFTAVDGEPVQVIAPARPGPLPLADLRALAGKVKPAEARRLATAFLRRPFVLESGPLLRLLLVRLSRDEHLLFLSIHHIVSDGWSMAVLADEVGAIYGAFSRGLASPLAPPPLQYADFAVWQRGWLTQEVLDAQLAYWRDRMEGAPGLLELPTDRPRPPVQSLAGDHLRFTLGAPLGEALQALAEKLEVQLYTVLVSAFKALLARYTGSSDLVLGSPIANRHRAELEGVIGFLVNMLVLRTDLSRDPTFVELSGRVWKRTLAGYDNQDLPFERLVEALHPERDLSTTPLFQVMFNLLNFPQVARKLPELVIDPWHVGTGTSKYDLSLYFFGGRTLTGFFEYSTDLFDETTVRRMLAHLTNVLEAVVEGPELRLSQLPLLLPAERHELLVERNDAEPECGAAPLGVHGLFEARVRRRPDAVALVAGGTAWLYVELNRRANRLAHYLRRRGVGPEVLVGLCVERSADMVVALLAVLKAGGAYVPLDPSHPPARLASVLADVSAAAAPRRRSTAGVLLTQSALRGTLPEHGGTLFCLDEDWAEAAGESEEDPRPHRLPGQLAYVIHTSGSTGRPKGVAVTHRSVVNFLRSMARRPGLAAEDVFLAVTTLSFDIAVLELLLPLTVGARLLMASREEAADGARLAARLAASGASAMQATPATWSLLAGAGFSGRAELSVLCGGEALPWTLAERLLESGAAVWNLYGPTETTIWSAVHEVGPSSSRQGRGTVPIGRPIAGTSLYVLDRRGTPVPLAAPGELSIGGAGLARGYLARPGLTAERFVPDPFGRPGARLYRTGDLVRRRTGGATEFLGRIDHQVKIRGYRIEPGEVERMLARHPGVRSAVVVAERRAEAQGDRLVAYLVPREAAHTPSVEALRRFLDARLPEYMVPSAFVVLERFALSSGGKVDRKALPAPDSGRPGLAARYQAPATRFERYLARAWRKLLGVERIGVHDRFFDLGGNSIQAAVFINRLQQELGEVLHVTALFRAQSIAEFVALLEKEYPRALRRWREKHERAPGGLPAASPAEVDEGVVEEGVDAFKILEMRRSAACRRSRRAAAREGSKNPPAVFILSPPRSGSTLLRVMLAGHPRLFSPPELELLGYDTLGERGADLTGAHGFAAEGLLRAIMELKGCDARRAKELMAGYEAQDLPVPRFYALLQEWSGSRTLVDKTTTYALDPETLERAEGVFEAPLYIHLLRHPCATVKSYVDVHLDQFLRFETPFTPRQQAELLWVVDHQNILRFLSGVPRERQLRVRFEDLLERPREVLGQVCGFLGLELAAPMLEPYAGRKMTDGLYAESRMHGDPRFHEHTAIEPSAAEKWKGSHSVSDLAEITRQIMESFGYPAPDERPSVTIAPRRDTESAVPAPLSFAQERLWLLHQIEPDNPAYNIASAVRLRGRLDVAALGRAFDAVTERHEALRTGFRTLDELPVQVVSPVRSTTWPLVDLRRLGGPLREAEATRLARRERRRLFDLSRAPLLRSTLLELTADHHVLLVTVHHIVSDGWSLGLLVREVAVLYEAALMGCPSPLPELAIQYPDFAVWQRRRLSGEKLESYLGYWRDKLAGLATLELATDRPRPPVQTFRGASSRFTLPAALSAAITALARRRGVSLFMTLLAAFKALLTRHTAQEDVVLGSPVANRPRRELEGLIGPFINTLVLRTDTSGDPAFQDLLVRVRDVALEAFAHQELPFERLVEALSPHRDLSRNPLFQVLFNLLSAPLGKLSLSGLELDPLRIGDRISHFDLTLFWVPGKRGLAGRWEYNPDLFDRSTVLRWANHLREMLRGTVERPESRLSELPLCSPAELQQVVREWNDTAAATARPLVHELFAARAGRAPAATALSCGDRWLSYGALSARAERLAHHLRGRGVGPEALVGVALERSPAMLSVLLGVLKAGGAYLPLDPSHPPERLAFMLDDSRVRILVSEEALCARLPATAAEVVRADRLEGPAEGPAPRPAVLPQHPAYVIYTSGSTGRPKGVQIPHGALVNFLASMARRPGLGTADVLLAVTSLGFDIAALELFLPLLAGARVELTKTGTAADGAALLDLLERSRATVVQATPTTWRLLLAAGWNGERRLEVLCGGEALPADLARALAGRGAAVWNMYGPTETTVWSAVARVGAAGKVSIGRPIRNTRIHLLDQGLRRVPVGTPGELFIGGEGLARGYLSRPGLTAERFVPDPTDGRGTRLYRTGDLARFLAEGRLEFLGRLDHQVKLRGHRIEPGEIEAALGRHPAVAEAAVVVSRAVSSDEADRLVAYVVPYGNGTPAVSELRDALKERLPSYMVPSRFVFREALPLTPNRKVDRAALSRAAASAWASPESEGGRASQPRPEIRTPYAAPASQLEKRLAAIWQELLGLARVGLHDDFFELGGHSLLAVRLFSRLRGGLGVELPMRTVFQARTVAEQAELASAARQAGQARAMPPLRPVPRRGELPVSFAQERLWLLDQLQGGSSAYNLPLALRWRGELEPAVLARGLEEVVRRHEVLRTTFETVDGRPVQRVAEPGASRLPLVDLAALPDGDPEARRLARREARRPFDLARDPMLRASLVRLGARDHLVLLTTHHIASDYWSQALLARELRTLYPALAAGKVARLPALPVQYADFAAWQREWLRGEVLERQIAYWKQQLAGELPVLELPLDRPRPELETFRGGRRRLALAPSLRGRLEAFSQEGRATPFMTLLTAFQVLLHRYSGQSDVVVGSPVASRGLPEVEALIGLFVNNLVLRADLAGDPPFRQALARVRAVTLEAYAHQDLPFERLVEELQPERDLSRPPLFQALFILHNLPTGGAERPGLPTRPLAIDRGTALYELSLIVNEPGGAWTGWLEYKTDLFDTTTIDRLASHLRTLLTHLPERAGRRLSELPLSSAPEGWQMLGEWNDSALACPRRSRLEELFAARAEHAPQAVALVGERHGAAGRHLSYGELERRVRRVARKLERAGVGPEQVVGLCMERCAEMVVGMLGILKAGGAYLPLDPSYPRPRLAFMARDAGLAVLLTRRRWARWLGGVTPEGARQLYLDAAPEAGGEAPAHPARRGGADNLAYVIYTSGSTGDPKGVMVPHRAVSNFFAGMDERIGGGEPGTWLAVTSMSFDISVLELLWTLTRGFRVVLQEAPSGRQGRGERAVDFSLFYFASDEGEPADEYRLLVEGAKFADHHGFTAIWTPERHFHDFGGHFPNPSVASAAVAALTERVGIRAGSVVMPLHNPVRVAEEWALVDNLSRGRVGVSFASGWHTNDFVFAPHDYADRKAVMFQGIETVRELWRGEAVYLPGGAGEEVAVKVRPRPVQRELPTWVTAAGNPETFRMAGEKGFNLLTHLLGQSLEELGEKIEIYRRSFRGHGRGGRGHVTLMLHTFVGRDLDEVRETVRGPLSKYLRSSVGLLSQLGGNVAEALDSADFTDGDMEALVGHAFDRYFETGGFFGTPETCLRRVRQLQALGVDEIACLIDFGVDVDRVLAGLRYLDEVREASRFADGGEMDEEPEDGPATSMLPELVGRHRVSHLQCTPSLAQTLAFDPAALESVKPLARLMLGGEALPPALAGALGTAVSGELHNMYGPTETTIWSATHTVRGAPSPVPIGRPIANTELHLVDRAGRPVPFAAAGELLIGGEGVTRGYLGRPAASAERFVPSPFGRRPGRRCYRTGDLTRQRPDGSFEFLGRTDHQVKIHGLRIELGEIEAALGRHPAVASGVVDLRWDGRGERAPGRRPGPARLVAYYVRRRGAPEVDAERLRRFLRRDLPRQMVPASFVELETLPRTPNGKVDRRALPLPDQELGAYVAPRDEIERAVAELWRQALKLDRVGVHDNFFELGGHSVLGVQLMHRLRTTFDVEIPLGALFRAPTVAELATMVLRLLSEQVDEHDLGATLAELEGMSEHEVRGELADVGGGGDA